MTPESPIQPKSTQNEWHAASLALLVGIAVMGAMVFLAALIRPPGLAPPPGGAIPLFVFTTTAAAISAVLLRRTEAAGYAAAIITGFLPGITVILVGTGTVGEIPSDGIQPGPVVFTALGLALLVTTVVAWQNRSPARPSSTATTPMEGRSENG